MKMDWNVMDKSGKAALFYRMNLLASRKDIGDG